MINIENSVAIIMENWIQAKKDELVHFVTDENHVIEANAFTKWAKNANIALKCSVLPSQLVQDGQIIEDMSEELCKANIIIGATDYSFITTNAVRKAIDCGARFLSLPLSCSNGSSMLQRDFITMNIPSANKDAQTILNKYQNKKHIHVTTKLGTDLTFSIADRKPGYFVGLCNKEKMIASASFEVYIAPIEDTMNGVLYLDGSFGYLGLVKEPIKIIFENGKIISIQDNEGGKKLIKYIESFNDELMYRPGEFGIGLNRVSKCEGVCYIEDESTYGTFHLGLGRNLSLGGKQNAKGHFDIVTHNPNIYFEDELIMKDGELL